MHHVSVIVGIEAKTSVSLVSELISDQNRWGQHI